MARIKHRRQKIKYKIRKKIEGTSTCPRLSVYKSNTAIYAQIIDDLKNHTLVADSSAEKNKKNKLTISASKEIGKKIAEKTLSQGISQVVFDRNGYLYHGHIKALAEGAREGGLKF